MKIELNFKNNGIHDYIKVDIYDAIYRKEDFDMLLKIIKLTGKYNEEAINSA